MTFMVVSELQGGASQEDGKEENSWEKEGHVHRP